MTTDMKNAIKVLANARAAGVHVEPRGAKGLLLWPVERVTDDIKNDLRANKRDIIELLSRKHFLKQIICGEFGRASAKHRHALLRELGRCRDPLIRRAMEALL